MSLSQVSWQFPIVVKKEPKACSRIERVEWNGVMPPTWDDKTTLLECRKKFEEVVLPHFGLGNDY